MATAFLQRGWLEFWVLELDGAPVAAQFCFRYKDTVYLLQEGFDPHYTKDRIGYALRANVLRHCIETGAKRYDFLGGSDPYKQKFGAQRESYLTINFAKPRTLGALYLRQEHLARSARTWLRANLPDPLVSALRSRRVQRPAQKQND
jgi:CelD/BcsL family acetyltransferase involved in cellulose biosynthesis